MRSLRWSACCGGASRRSKRRCLCFPETIFGMDVDDAFAYTAAKSVRIRDMRLGLLHYTLMTGIFAYIVVYQLIYNWGYLKFSDPKAAVRLTMQQPTVDQCNPNNDTCHDDFVALDQLPYCCPMWNNASCTNNPDGSCSCDFRPNFRNYNCTYLDGADVQTTRESSIFVSTFTHAYSQKRNADCFSSVSAGNNECKKLWLPSDNVSPSDTMAFTANIEDYTLLIDHSVTGSDGSHSYTSRQMEGRLAITGSGPSQDRLCKSDPDATRAGWSWTGILFDTNESTNRAPCLLKPKSVPGIPGADVFAISTLMEAMGAPLDNRSYEGSKHSRRYDGVVVKIAIQYHNVRLWRIPTLATPYYFYNVSIINGSTYKEVDVVFTSFPTERQKLDKHGILFEVSSAGQLASFSATNLLIQLTTSLTLMAMATVIVNVMAQYVLKFRHYYQESMYDVTVDFSDLRRVHEMTDVQLETELRNRNLEPKPGPRQRRVTQLLEAGYEPESVASSFVDAGGRSPSALAHPLQDQA